MVIYEIYQHPPNKVLSKSNHPCVVSVTIEVAVMKRQVYLRVLEEGIINEESKRVERVRQSEVGR